MLHCLIFNIVYCLNDKNLLLYFQNSFLNQDISPAIYHDIFYELLFDNL